MSLRLLHPIMPFITEELWQTIAPMCDAKTADSIMLAPFPVYDSEWIDQTAFDKMNTLQELIGVVRNLRGEMGIAPSVKAPFVCGKYRQFGGLFEIFAVMARFDRSHTSRHAA